MNTLARLKKFIASAVTAVAFVGLAQTAPAQAAVNSDVAKVSLSGQQTTTDGGRILWCY